jgi:CheY-like chemotaxis protein
VRYVDGCANSRNCENSRLRSRIGLRARLIAEQWDVIQGEAFPVMSFSAKRRAIAPQRYRRPDLVITDLAMPDIDGIEFCRRV